MYFKKMVLDQHHRRVTDINTYEAACWSSFALEIFYSSTGGVTYSIIRVIVYRYML